MIYQNTKGYIKRFQYTENRFEKAIEQFNIDL